MRRCALGTLGSVILLSCVAQALQGPDVVTYRVGERISGSQDITRFSPANGRDAYSFCAVACNIGSQELLWEGGGSARHPVIAQNMFRLKSGRFEQLGQSFLKHGFCAVSELGCGACQPTPCATLGIGCADTYSSGTNDGQGGGRKSDVSATPGSHPHPYTAASGSDPNRGRLQVYIADLDPAVGGNDQAEYFIEAHYVAEDDHLFGNAANNASWRKVAVDANRDLSGITGHETVIQPAIYAWRAEDVGVVVNEVASYNEGGPGVHGFYYVASRATDNGNGTWTYSYAVQNLCSDAAGYSFAVPADSGVSVSNAWFTAPEWHSDEVYNNDPWLQTHTGGMVRWTCAQTHAQDPDANALRWGTLFSFGFTADRAPVTGTAELTLFASGGLLSTAVASPDAGASIGCPADDVLEDNDDCAAALPIGYGDFTGLQIHGSGSTPDWDYYSIELHDTATLTVDLFFFHALGDLDLYLYVAGAAGCGSVGSELAGSSTVTDDETLTYQNTSGALQNLVIEVRTAGGVGCTDYDLATTFSSVPVGTLCTTVLPDGLEENDTCASAAVISPGSYLDLTVFGSGCTVDEDFYAFTVPPGEIVDIHLVFYDDAGDIDAELFELTGGCPGSMVASGTTPTDDELLSWTNSAGTAASCRLRVYGYGAYFLVNEYDLSLVFSPQPVDTCTLPDDGFEQNDDCASPAALLSGSYAGLWLDITEDDYFSTIVAPGETIDVDIYFIDAEADLDLYFFEPSDPTCGDQDSTTYLARSWTATDDESCSWTNSTGAPMEVITFVHMWGAGTEDCVLYDLELALDGQAIGTRFCVGDQSCPCVAPAPGSGEGCVNVTGVGALITGAGVPSASADTLVLTVHQAAPDDFGIFVQNIGVRAVAAPFYNGLFCLNSDAHLVRHYSFPSVLPTFTDSLGRGTNAQALTLGDYLGDTQPGVTIYYQFWGRDNGNPCGFGANFSSGLAVTWSP